MPLAQELPGLPVELVGQVLGNDELADDHALFGPIKSGLSNGQREPEASALQGLNRTHAVHEYVEYDARLNQRYFRHPLNSPVYWRTYTSHPQFRHASVTKCNLVEYQ